MLASAWPVSGSDHEVSRLPEARARLARVQRMQGEQTAAKLEVTAAARREIGECSNRSELNEKAITLRDIEVKHDGSSHHRARDHVESDG